MKTELGVACSLVWSNFPHRNDRFCEMSPIPIPSCLASFISFNFSITYFTIARNLSYWKHFLWLRSTRNIWGPLAFSVENSHTSCSTSIKDFRDLCEPPYEQFCSGFEHSFPLSLFLCLSLSFNRFSVGKNVLWL